MDDHRRVALLRFGPAHPDDRGPATAFHLADHLGSSTAVVDDTGTLTNREEYTPYGETSFGGYTRKRYRFTGQERDEESGLSHHGARHYAPWTGRWTSCDPLGPVDGPNLYLYVRGNPLTGVDKNGTEDSDSKGTNVGGDQFSPHGKGMREVPFTLDIDEPAPVGEQGISTTVARTRALDVTNRQFLDSMTNRRTKFLGQSQQPRVSARAPVSVATDPHALITRYFDEVSEMRDIFAHAVGKVRDPNSMRPTALKEAINAHIWEIIKTDQGGAASRVRTALGIMGFDNVPKVGYVMRSPAGASTPAPTVAVGPGVSRGGPPPTVEGPGMIRRLATVDNAAKALEYGGYAAFAVQLGTAKTSGEAVNATTNFLGAAIAGTAGGALFGTAGAMVCGPCEPVFQAAGQAVGTYAGAQTTEIIEKTDWKDTLKEVAFVGGMALLCLL
jgi:RHS repeat-associated protein